ncbi:MAG: hypothetical protein R3F62_10900 [Planctomycetota bacterium]
MTLRTTLTAFALCGALACGLAGCSDEQGPLEGAGETLDDAGKAIVDEWEDLTDDKDTPEPVTAEDAGPDGPLENLGETLDEAGEELHEEAEEAWDGLNDDPQDVPAERPQ